MKKYIKILYVLTLIFIISCSEIEKVNSPTNDGVTKTFIATLEKGDQTKTTLDGELGDPIRKIMWSPNDEILMFASGGNIVGDYMSGKFTNTLTEPSEVTSFTGNIGEALEYYALYPYNEESYMQLEDYWCDSLSSWLRRYSFSTIIPNIQQYQKESFANGSFPMIAKTNENGILDFKNLFGVMVINLTGEETIRTIKFSARNSQDRNATLCGPCRIPLDSIEFISERKNYYTFINPEDQSIITDAITLDCGEEGVTLNTDTPTRFYFVLPPATYYGFNIAITTTDGKTMYKQGKNNLVIKRSNVSKSGALEYLENITIDLSFKGTSNCYIVSEPGFYSFDATTIGNGEYGIIADAGFHTNNTDITPVSAEILWQDRTTEKIYDIIRDVTYDSETGTVSFSATGTEGNALIAVRDSEGTILWSWHIWCTDQPLNHKYKSGYTFMDRNLGAIRNSRGDGNDWITSSGMVYQWGRKDPFSWGNDIQQSGVVSIESSIQNPTTFTTENEWMETPSATMWDEIFKTIYDPCPVGYRVPPSNAWNGVEIDGNWDNGNHFLYDDINIAWYPGTKRANWGIPHQPNDYYFYIWSSSRKDTDTSPSRLYGYRNNTNFSIGTDNPGVGLEIRCIADNGYINTSLPQISITDISDLAPTSVNISCLLDESDKAVSSAKGIAYSTETITSLESENVFIVESESVDSEFTLSITDLTPSTQYYIRAFATNEYGTSYSEELVITTPSALGESIDLSANGTANCYIITSYATYSFNCSVKGSTTESVGRPYSAAVLWETKNTTLSVGQGEIISEVTLEGDKIFFKPSMSMTPGNALIVVKDKSGTIIWSWHIWVVNFDPNATAEEYPSGAILMDRNLGALSNEEGNIESYGLLYQWGRKDPFVGSGDGSYVLAATYPSDIFTVVSNSSEYNNIDYATANPSHFIQYSSWNSSSYRYWDDSKGVHDPCPPGWRVPDGYPHVWVGANISDHSYPLPGYLSDYFSLNSINSNAYFWTCTNNRYVSIRNSSINNEGTRSVGYGYSIRCMKDYRFTISSVTINSIGSVDVTLSATLTAESEPMDSKGFVICSSDGDPHLFTENAIVAYCEENSAGDYTIKIGNLTPHTTYYVKAFATGGHNTRYSEVASFTTKHAANDDDGFTMDDFEW